MTDTHTVRHHCPITTCRWFHDDVASDFPTDTPADPIYWSAATWGLIADWTQQAVTTVQVVDAHLVTHSPVEWMTELARERRLRHDAEYERGLARAAVEQTAFLTDSVDSVASQRMPSRAEVESTREQLAGLVGTAHDG